MRLHVADATDADVPELTRLINAAYRTPGDLSGWTDERDLLDGPRTDDAMVGADVRSSRVLVLRATPAGPILACLGIAVAEGGAWYLSSVAVDPARQAEGIGRALLTETERQAREASVSALRMTVIQLRTTLIAWYERRGFRRTGAIVPFPYGDARVGRPLRDDLSLLVLEKPLELSPRRSSCP